MKDKDGQKRRGNRRSDGSEIGRVRVFSNPGPDAEDRLRRLTSLMIKYATQAEWDASAEDLITDSLTEDDTTDVDS